MIGGTGIGVPVMLGAHGALLAERFSAHNRFTGFGMGRELGSVLFAGLTPVIADVLVSAASGGSWPVSVYVILASVLTLVTGAFIKETMPQRNMPQSTAAAVAAPALTGPLTMLGILNKGGPGKCQRLKANRERPRRRPARPNRPTAPLPACALERGLAVIKFFTGAKGPVTISAIARGTGFDRAVIRRILGTLENTGYVSRQDGGFVLTPSVLELGYAYLSSDPLPRIAEARLRPLAERFQESCSLGVLQRGTVLYLARVQIKWISGPSLIVGTTIEPYVTAIGRVLLAALDPADLDSYLAKAALEPVTPRTITSAGRLRAELDSVARQGWCLVEEELELGLLALAVPVHSPDGRVIGAVNIVSHTSRTTKPEFFGTLYPQLKATAERIDTDLKHAYQ